MVKARPFFPKWQGIQGFDLSLGTEAAFPSCGENDLWVLVRWFLTFEGLVASQVLETVWRALVAKDAALACWELLRCKSRFRNCVAGLVQRKTQQMRLSKHRTTSHHLTLRTSPPEMTNQFRFAKYYDWWTDTVIWVNPNRCFIYSSFDAPLFTPKKKGLSLTASQSVGQEMSQRPPHLPIKADFINFLLQQVWEVAALPTSRAKWLTRIPRIEFWMRMNRRIQMWGLLVHWRMIWECFWVKLLHCVCLSNG